MSQEDLARSVRRVRHFKRFFKLVQHVLNIKLSVHGLENVPEKGPFIIATNHMSVIDTFAVGVAIPAFPSRLFVGEKWKEHFIIGPMFEAVGGIFVKRGEVDRRALKEAVEALQEGYIFGLAPEGRRIKGGSLAKGKDGASYLASRAKVPVVPVSIINSDKWAETYKRLGRTHVEVVLGEPFELPDLGRKVRSRDLKAYTHLIMVKIAQNLPPRYYGYYVESPALAAALRGEDPWPYCLEAEGVEYDG